MRRNVFVGMIVLATIGSSAGEGRICDNPEICLLEEPGAYHAGADKEKMRTIIADNKPLIDAQELETFENFTTEGPTGDSDNCQQITTIRQPYVLQTNDSSTYNIVQLEHFVQKVKWTECFNNNPKKPCFESVFTRGVSEVETQCGEKYGGVSLYVYEPSEGAVVYKMVPVPVACECRFKTVSNY